MFCKICYDSSTPGFDGHNVRDSAGNLCCPVLANTKCRNCGLFGHTVKYCNGGTTKNGVSNYGGDVRDHFQTIANVKHVKMTRANGGIQASYGRVMKNRFAELDMDSDADSDADSDVGLDVEIDDDDPSTWGKIIWGVGFTTTRSSWLLGA